MSAPSEAANRAENWLRQRQVNGPHDVLIITGRGTMSGGGTPPVHEAVRRRLFALRRVGVITLHREQTAGSFQVSLAPMRSMIDAPRRNRVHHPRPSRLAPASLASLKPETLRLLRESADTALSGLGVKMTEAFLDDEMLRQLRAISTAVPEGPNREERIQTAIRRLLREYG